MTFPSYIWLLETCVLIRLGGSPADEAGRHRKPILKCPLLNQCHFKHDLGLSDSLIQE